MIRIKSTIQVIDRAEWKPNHLTLGDMKSFWKREGNFNQSLYSKNNRNQIK